MLHSEILQLVAVALGSSGFTAIVTKLIDRRAIREESEIGRLREDIAECKASHEVCEKNYADLSERVRAVEASTPSYLARWVKDQDKRMLWLNDRAYLMMFAPLGWGREEVLDKTFDELLGEGSGEATRLIEELDVLALRHPGETQSVLLQLHPELPTMAIIKVAFVANDGLLRYEGCAYVPSGLADSISRIRAAQAREEAARRLFQEGDGR